MMELNEDVRFERTMELSAKAGVSIEDARAALNANDYDMLNAMIYLEHLGKTTSEQLLRGTNPGRTHKVNCEAKKAQVKSFMGKLFDRIKELVKKGNENYLNLSKNGKDIINIPLTIVVIAFIISFWFCLPLAIVLLFFGIRYSFVGKDFKEDDVFNGAMNKASSAADGIKRDFSESVNGNV